VIIVNPYHAKRANLTSGTANAASSDATVRSHASTISQPLPYAMPLITAIIGFEYVAIFYAGTTYSMKSEYAYKDSLPDK